MKTNRMTMEPVFDGGTRTKVADGIFMKLDGNFVIAGYVPGEGWTSFRRATEAEIRTWQELKRLYQGTRVSIEIQEA